MRSALNKQISKHRNSSWELLSRPERKKNIVGASINQTIIHRDTYAGK